MKILKTIVYKPRMCYRVMGKVLEHRHEPA